MHHSPTEMSGCLLCAFILTTSSWRPPFLRQRCLDSAFCLKATSVCYELPNLSYQLWVSLMAYTVQRKKA
jgi:hypothetical protein